MNHLFSIKFVGMRIEKMELYSFTLYGFCALHRVRVKSRISQEPVAWLFSSIHPASARNRFFSSENLARKVLFFRREPRLKGLTGTGPYTVHLTDTTRAHLQLCHQISRQMYDVARELKHVP
jgi:hypothetical protein